MRRVPTQLTFKVKKKRRPVEGEREEEKFEIYVHCVVGW
jgi:hypothetical protein